MSPAEVKQPVDRMQTELRDEGLVAAKTRPFQIAERLPFFPFVQDLGNVVPEQFAGSINFCGGFG